MAVIRLKGFGGELPQLNPQYLPARNAVTCRNAQMFAGSLQSVLGPLQITGSRTASTPTTIFKYDNTNWFEWLTDVDAVRSTVQNDTLARVCFTGSSLGYPAVTDSGIAIASGAYPSAAYKLGTPAPTTQPGVSKTGTPGGSPETRFYVYTYVNSYGEESPPSPVSNQLDVESGETAQLTLTAPPSSGYNWSYIRIYRSNTSGDAAVFQFVKEVAYNTASTSDTVAAADLGEPLPSETWDPPPTDMIGLISVPGAFLAGFRKNELLFSEVGLPHAWPIDYRKSVDFEIVGIAALDSGLAVLTKGKPYLAMGSNPASMVPTGVSVPYACVAKRGIVVLNGEAVFPTPRGLAAISPGSARMVTEGVLNTDDWDAINPSTIRAFRWRNLYIGFFTKISGGTDAFVFDPANPEAGIARFDGFDIGGGYVDLLTDKLYVSYNLYINQWNAGAKWTYTWQSRPFAPEMPTTMGVAQVRAEEYPVTLTVLRDGEEQCRVDIADGGIRRLSNVELGRTYSIRVDSKSEVREVLIASSAKEIKLVKEG